MKCCITILYHAIKNTEASMISAVEDGTVGCNAVLFIQQLSSILIACSFYDTI